MNEIKLIKELIKELWDYLVKKIKTTSVTNQ